MNYKKTLILIDNNNNNFFPDKIGENRVLNIYKSNAYLNRVFRKILFKIHFPLMKIFFTDWDKEAKKSDLIILLDTGNAKYLLPYLKKKYKDSKIILWYWNPVSKSIDPSDVDYEDIEVWSFDPEDCKKYGFKYNTQFFVNSNIERAVKCNLDEFDVFFIGTDKGRHGELIKLKELFDSIGAKYHFHIVGDTQKEIPGFESNYLKPLSYFQLLGYDIRSKVIVDIVSEGQNGLTLRPLEAMFLNKKLITNFKKIKEYDFYDPQNIFILGVDDPADLKKFIFSDYKYVDEKIKLSYDITAWLSRFDDER